MKLNRVKSNLWKHKRITLAVGAAVLATVILGVVLRTGPVMAGGDALSLYKEAMAEQGLPVMSTQVVAGAAGSRLEVVLQSQSRTGSVSPDDKENQHRILRSAALFKAKGLDVDEVALDVLAPDGTPILTMERPLEEGIPVPSSTEQRADPSAVVRMVKEVLAREGHLDGLTVRSVEVHTLPDGAQALLIVTEADAPDDASASMQEFLGNLRWVFAGMWSAEIGPMPPVICVHVDDAAGNPLVRYISDTQLQQDSGWFAPGMATPGPRPYEPPEAGVVDDKGN